jgi:nicotinamide mononucleotide adenylyltransferase
MKLGFIIARLQVPYLHAGHLNTIATSLRECDETIILLGCKEAFDERNPYTIKERVDMINKIFPQVEIVVLWDELTDERWSHNVDTIISNFNGSEAILYYSRDSFKDHYKGKYPTKEVHEVEGYSGTKIRESIKN